MLAAVSLFIVQVVEQRRNALALAADAEHIGLRAVSEVDELADEATGREPVALVAVEGRPGQADEVGTALFVSVFEGVERIEQHPPHEAHLGMAVGSAVGRAELLPGHVFQRIAVYVSRREIGGQHLLHPLVRIGRFGSRGPQAVVAVLPGLTHEIGEVRSLTAAEFPAEHDRCALGQVPVGADRRGQREFAVVAVGRLLIGESEAERGTAPDVLEARESDRRIAREDHLAARMGGQRIAAGPARTQHRAEFSAGRVEDARERGAETVFADGPAVGHAERGRLFRRPEILAVPEARHQELAFAVGEFGFEGLAVLEPDLFQRRDAHLDRTAVVVRRLGGDDGDGEHAARLQQKAAVAGAGRERIVDGRIPGRLQRDRVAARGDRVARRTIAVARKEQAGKGAEKGFLHKYSDFMVCSSRSSSWLPWVNSRYSEGVMPVFFLKTILK